MAENDAHLRKTGQPAPYINPAHFTDPVPGFVGPLTFVEAERPSAAHPKGRPARVVAEVQAEEWIARQVLAGRRPWRSVEVTKHAEAADFHGMTGPVLRGLALLNTHPRRKNLDSPVYADRGITCFEEPAGAGSVYVTSFQEIPMPDMAQILAALEALGGDSEKLKAVAKALGLGGDPAAPETAAAADPTTEETPPEKPEEDMVPMSEVAALKRQLATAQKQADEGVKLGTDALKRERNRQIDIFAERLVRGYGPARAEREIARVKKLLDVIPLTEVYAEDGKQHTEIVFAECLEAMGKPIVEIMSEPAVRQQSGGRGKIETYAEAARSIVEDAKNEPGQPAMSVLRNPAFKHVLERMARRRMQEVG